MLDRYDFMEMDNPHDPDRLIDAALDEYPLAQTPHGFTARVMAEVWRPALAFHLEFVDFAVPAFIALFAAFLFGLGMYAFLSIDRLTRLQLELQGKILLAHLSVVPEQAAFLWLPLVVMCCLAMFGIALGVGIWMVRRPVWSSQ